MRIAKTIILFVLACLLAGCQPFSSVTVDALKEANAVNTVSVEALETLQAQVRRSRSDALELVAKTASSKEEGLRQMDEVDRAYGPVFEAFREAEDVQHLLADGIEAGKAAIEAGKDPNMPGLIVLYMKVQALYGELMRKIAQMER